ncbi:LysR family transcriptional regulator [Trinickia fusca]|uniref:LysR family transcriptional regulator n=1 Tax=Trinickia fusca TaxID=2419777 RepID=A0A494XJ74_9BURK|nr:LysR family transcriptional regulator [Trinickia fusca]RKP48134.1 LysR family transcriptional regulator [Trinickia fusca]
MLRELRTFLAVVRFGTFASAGANVGLTQSAVSAQIHRLEEELGFPLFDRTGRAATLNEAGRRTADVAEELLSVYERLQQQGGETQRSGLLRVGAIATAQTSFLIDAIARFRRDSPGWQIRLVPGVSLDLLAKVDAGEFDCAVIIRPPFALPPELKWHTLTTEPYGLLVPRALRNRPWRELLSSEPFIRYDRHSFGGGLVDRFLRKMRVTVHDAIELDELQGIVGLVGKGAGVALVPLSQALNMPRNVATLSLGTDTFVREIGVLERSATTQRDALTKLLACIEDAVDQA